MASTLLAIVLPIGAIILCVGTLGLFFGGIAVAVLTLNAYFDGKDSYQKDIVDNCWADWEMLNPSVTPNRHGRLTAWAFEAGYSAYERKADRLARNISRNCPA